VPVQECALRALASETDPARVAKQWHDTDEMRDWSAEEVLEVVKEVAALARCASAADSTLVLVVVVANGEGEGGR
jgi:adenylate kinase